MAKILDSHGNPLDLAALRQELAAPALTSIRNVFREDVARGLTPQRLATVLLQSEQGDPEPYLALAEQMEEKDLNYRAQLGTRKLACASLPFEIESASDSAEDKKAADMVREMLRDDGVEDTFTDILDGMGKGFSVSEILWDTSGKEWHPERVVWRDPRWFTFDLADGDTVLLRGPGMPTPLPGYKFIVHKPKLKSGIPIRGGLARASAWAYLFANYGLKDWVGFCELFGQPLRVGKYPAGSQKEQIDVLKQAVYGLGSDAAAVLPEGMVVDIIQAQTTGNADLYEKLLRFLDERVTLAVLGQTLTSGQSRGGGGSLALGQVHNEVRRDLMRADARQLAATLNRDLVRPLVDLNLGPRAAYPKLRFSIEEPEDLATLADNLSKLVPLGLKVEQSVIRDKMGLPDPADGADLLTMSAAPPPQDKPPVALTAQQSMTPCPHCGVAHAQGDGPKDKLDQMAERELGDWIPLMAPIARPLIEAIQNAQSLEEMKAALAAAAGKVDPSALTEALARSGFAARLAGEAGVDLG